MAVFDCCDVVENEAGYYGDALRGAERILPRRFVRAPFSLGCCPSCSFLLMSDCVLPLVRAGAWKALLGKGVKSAVNGYVRCFSA